MPKTKRAQLRVCSVCNKPGHNRSTCPVKFSSLQTQNNTVQPPKTGLNFYIHHVAHEPHQSPHVLDLKKPKIDLLEKIASFAPNETESLYHSYHQSKPEAPTKTTAEKPNRVFPCQTPLAKPSIPVSPPVESTINVHRHTNWVDTDEQFTPHEVVFRDSIPATNVFEHNNELPSVQPVKKHIEFKPLSGRAVTIIQNWITTTVTNTLHNLPWKKIAFAIAALALILIAPFQANSYYRNVRLTTEKIASDGRTGFMSLQESTAAILHADINGAQNSLNTALNKFAGAIDTMETKHQWLQKMTSAIPMIGNEVTSRQQLILAGQKIALGNTYLIKGLSESQKENNGKMTDRLDLVIKHLDAALPNYHAALKDLGTVDEDTLPLEYQAPFKDFKVLFTTVLDDLQNLSELGKTVKEIFGGQGLRRYLLVFQNPSELRPTGGFVGSFALLEVRDGKIINMSIPPGGSYDLKGQLSERLEPPTPLLLINDKWQFQDSNWYPDFPKSAQKMMWFYRKSREITVDGVVAINASVLERLLGIIGPIQDEKRDITISADNALDTIQQEVESTSTRATKKPKQIIADLAPQFLEYFQNIKPEYIVPILTNLQDALRQKDIQAYFTDYDTEQTIKKYGWGGEIADTNSEQDYLMVVNTNIGGQKSDARINQTISHQAVINDDGSITDTVIITRAHTGNTNEDLYGVNNVDYLRIYVPANSELIEASGFTWPDESHFRAPDKWAKKDADLAQIEKETSIDNKSGTRITNEFGKTAFGNWVITEPGQTTQVHFVYRLPFKAKIYSADTPAAGWQNLFLGNELKTALKYQLVTQNQSGANSTFESQIILPTGWQPIWQDGHNIKIAANGVAIENMNLDKDYIWSLLAQNK